MKNSTLLILGAAAAALAFVYMSSRPSGSAPASSPAPSGAASGGDWWEGPAAALGNVVVGAIGGYFDSPGDSDEGPELLGMY